MANPLLRSVNIVTPDVNVSLFTLLLALDQNIFPRCQYVQIQAAIDGGAATAIVRVVNESTGSDTDCGVELVSTQAVTYGPTELNTVNLKNIFVRSDVANTRLNISIIVK